MLNFKILASLALFFCLAAIIPSGAVEIDVDAKIEACLKDGCVATMDYRPLCGSDGKDYPNYSVMRCRSDCGKPYDAIIEKASDGNCKTASPSPKPKGCLCSCPCSQKA